MWVFPMDWQKTRTNSLLFNTGLILLTSIPICQFMANALPIYARSTSVDLMFGVQIKYLPFFRYFYEYNIFVCLIIGWSAVSLVVNLFSQPQQNKLTEAKLNEILKDGKGVTISGIPVERGAFADYDAVKEEDKERRA